MGFKSIFICRLNATDGDSDHHLEYTILWNNSKGYDGNQQNVELNVLKASLQILIPKKKKKKKKEKKRKKKK